MATPKNRNRLTWPIILTIVLVFNVMILTGLAVIYFHMTQEDLTLKCSSCNESQISFSDCCTDNQLGTAQHFEKVIEKKLADRLDNWNCVKWQQLEIDNMTVVVPLPKPAAHLTISSLFKPHQHNQEGLQRLDSWDTSTNNAFLGNGVNIWDGCIVTPVDGLYFVYSQVHFMKAASQMKHEEGVSLIHTIYRRSRITGTSQCLIEQKDSLVEPGQTGITEKSSYVSSTVNLYGGDHLCVLVNHIDLVHPNGASTYFGMYLT